MLLNFICKAIVPTDVVQQAIFEKTNKSPGKIITPIVGTLILTDTIVINIVDKEKFDTYKIGEEYNFEILSSKIQKPEKPKKSE